MIKPLGITTLCLLVLLTHAPTQVFAQAATRCEDAAGKVTYVDGLCPTGSKSTRQVSAAPIPHPREQAAAIERASTESKQLEKLRVAQEKEEKKNGIAKVRADKTVATKKAACDRKLTSVKRAQKKAAEATGKTANSKKQRASLLQEDYEADCKKS